MSQGNLVERKYLTVEQAVLMVKEAQKEVDEVPTYRLGQALWNKLDNEVCNLDVELFDSHYKFYNTLDNELAVKYFYDNYVIVK